MARVHLAHDVVYRMIESVASPVSRSEVREDLEIEVYRIAEVGNYEIYVTCELIYEEDPGSISGYEVRERIAKVYVKTPRREIDDPAVVRFFLLKAMRQLNKHIADVAKIASKIMSSEYACDSIEKAIEKLNVDEKLKLKLALLASLLLMFALPPKH